MGAVPYMGALLEGLDYGTSILAQLQDATSELTKDFVNKTYMIKITGNCTQLNVLDLDTPIM